MDALECLREAKASGTSFQRPINAFVDEFRRASPARKEAMVTQPIPDSGPLEGLVAAVVSALCRQAQIPAPPWVAFIGSPEPFFAFPAESYALRVRLMLESPPPFRLRRVFVPENYLERA
jgi:hypothetical protein